MTKPHGLLVLFVVLVVVIIGTVVLKLLERLLHRCPCTRRSARSSNLLSSPFASGCLVE